MLRSVSPFARETTNLIIFFMNRETTNLYRENYVSPKLSTLVSKAFSFMYLWLTK